MKFPILGSAWYPEQWPQSVWESDLKWMQEAHVQVLRIGEFAWSSMEPQEGVYDLNWLEAALNTAARYGMMVVLGTPTPTPPVWLTTKYPDTLNVNDAGVRAEHGNRQQFSFASHRYRKLAYKIVQQLAFRFGHHPAVIGWQLDNEIQDVSFDPEAKAQFRTWLKERYTNIGALNDCWANKYWSMTYDDFDQIPVHESDENPALLLDWRRFVSHTWKSYLNNQISAIREYSDPRHFVTTNTMGWFTGFDAYVIHESLDMAAWDNYVENETYDWVDTATRHDLTRGFKNKNFWVMECAPGFANWKSTNVSLRKGLMRNMAWQSVAHGSDAVLYWQMRSAPNGQETYHATLLGADGTPVPGYYEIQQLGADFNRVSCAITGTSPCSEVAVIHDYESRWAINFQRHAEKFDPFEEMKAFYSPLRSQAQSVDIVSPAVDLTAYKLVVAPALNIVTDATAANLEAFVKNGGHLVLGPRSGMKNSYNGLQPARQPGPLVSLLGGRVEQFYALNSKVPVYGTLGNGTASVWAELLRELSPETEALLHYGNSNGWLDNQPAVLTRKVGDGRITYVGAWLDNSLLNRLVHLWLQEKSIKPHIPEVPEDVEVCSRISGQRQVLILISHSYEKRTVRLPKLMSSVLDDGEEVSEAVLDPFCVLVVTGNVE